MPYLHFTISTINDQAVSPEMREFYTTNNKRNRIGEHRPSARSAQLFNRIRSLISSSRELVRSYLLREYRRRQATLSRIPQPGDLHLEVTRLHEVLPDEPGLALLVLVLDEAQGDVLAQGEAEAGGGDGAAQLVIPVDGLAAPGPGVQVSGVLDRVQQQHHEQLPHSLVQL